MISVTAEEMRRVDDLAIGKYKIHLEQMMELADYHLAICARESLNGSLAEKGVVVLAGKGNNGGGGLVAARHLSNWGCRVAVVVSHGDGLGDVVKERLETLKLMGLEITYFNEALDLKGTLSASDLVVDVLIGYSLRGRPRPPTSSMIEEANESGLPVISLDVPSGLDPTTGEAHGSCVRANKTLTLALPKRGLMVEAARKYVGELYVADIGIPPELYSEMGLKVEAMFSTGSLLRVY